MTPLPNPDLALAPARARRRTGVGLLVLGGVMLANGALGVTWLFSGDETTRFSETAAMWSFLLFQAVYFAELALLALLIPGLGAVLGATGRRLPRWVIGTLTVALVFQAGTVYSQAFIAPWLADVAPDVLDIEDGGLFQLTMMIIWVLWSLALVALGIAGAVRRVVPITGAVLIIVGALVIPVFGPIGTIAIGAGLVIWGVRMVQRRIDAERVPALPVAVDVPV